MKEEKELKREGAKLPAPTGYQTFRFLSEEAQSLIVRAFVGEFDGGPAPSIPESVKAEIAEWAYSQDDGLEDYVDNAKVKYDDKN
jgi:hypothetical protein